ncbi:uncharacterized protein FSUBG_7890 [Fusarium subglutinans]|uniref:Fungal N-terminal domain-containing protein n=1 Tax=Gibberella subglutinans TaxID=42677 RepID=A0A8H5PRS3_GIBSU|nr:uncharacterized protein FSUBG_7890 [Fusarium subglutinans]KAF5602215.1 hypothetical protein FSUBG_7890 [Fusarium subglutinans]
MAEAFGIAGSAFGTVSLGLQLFKEISQYLDDIDGREEDLKEARNYATNIELSLNALDVAISNAPPGDATTKNAIDSCKASCISAVNNLLAVVKELKGPTITLPNSNVTRAKELLRAKLKYPFKKQNIQKLEEILSRTNSALQTVLQVFQLNMGHTTTSALNNMHQAVVKLNAIWERNTTALDEIHKTSQLHDEKLTTIQQDVTELLILTRDSDNSKLLLRSMAQRLSDLTSRTCVAANLLQNPVSQTFIPNIETTSYQGRGSMTFNAFCSCQTQRVRYSQRYWGPLLLEAEVRSRDHHAPECPMSKLPASTRQTERVLSLLIPTGQRLWGRASKVSLSFTTGAGILGLGQKLTWVATVDKDSSPVFRMVRTVRSYEHLQRKDTNTLLASCFRRLVWCYSNHHASVTDVNVDGDTVLEWLLKNHRLHGLRNALKADNMAELCQMLAVIVKPTAYRHKATAEPIQAVVANSGWFSDCTRPVEVATAILSHYNQPVGHYHQDYRLSWWKSDNDRRGAYTLFQILPQVVENLEFGRLACAIINQDLDRVRQLLEKSPSHVNEINYCGQSPIHLAIETQNVAVIRIILHYADPEVLNARDNDGRYPIDYAIRTGKHAEEAQAVCCACKVLELLLQSDTGIFPASLYEGLNSPYICTEAQKILIKGLAERRERLKHISYQSLSPVERQRLGVNQARILDQNAVQVQSQLEARGCFIPMSLKEYEEKGRSADAQKSIYSYICSGKVAEYAHQLGFHYSDNEFWDFVSIFPIRMRIHSFYGFLYTNTVITCSYLCWMINRGSNISAAVPDTKSPKLETGLTAAHYFMLSLGLASEARRKWAMDCPLSPSAFKIAFSDTSIDNCRCWCSQSARSPLALLLAGIYLFERYSIFVSEHDLLDRLTQSTEFIMAGLFSTHQERIKEYQWVFNAILRCYTSFMLGLRHFCGVLIRDPTDPSLEEESREIQEEDSFLLELFESLLEEFRVYPLHNGMRLEDFFGWMRMVWAPRMRDVEQYLDKQRLTDEQLRDTESIGVVWEIGPQPRDESSKRCDVEEPDLWDAMDELDQIATDPERPTKESLQAHT